jgi:hypothetical protein
MQGRWLFSLAVLALTAVAQARGEGVPTAWLTGTEISNAIAGKTLEGRYANGRAFTERYGPDGRVEYFDDGRTIGGRWSVTVGTLCTIYDNDPAGGCFRVSRVSENCFEFYFASRTEETAPGPDDARPHWTALGSVRGEASTCQEGASA